MDTRNSAAIPGAAVGLGVIAALHMVLRAVEDLLARVKARVGKNMTDQRGPGGRRGYDAFAASVTERIKAVLGGK